LDKERHAGKVVLVTGGGSGIGRATALRFAEEGAERVIVVDHFGDRLERVSGELRERGTEPGAIRAELAEIPECERAIRSALKVIAVNLTASFAIGQRAARAMVDSGRGGVILFTTSISSLGGSPEFSHYNAAKAGTANLVKTMALELVGHGIRVNCVSPGPSDTQQSVDLVGQELMEKWRREGFPLAPMGRLGSPEDMAAAFSFLASDEAAYVTGVNLVVDGGLTAHAYSVPES